jgi:hypothetical protein
LEAERARLTIDPSLRIRHLLASTGERRLADDWSGLAVIVTIAAVFIAIDGMPPKDAPCVYKHTDVVDWFGTNARKRTCNELMAEANSRITNQQVSIKDAVDKLDQANAIIAGSRSFGASQRYGQTPEAATAEAAESAAPTLSAEARPDDDE